MNAAMTMSTKHRQSRMQYIFWYLQKLSRCVCVIIVYVDFVCVSVPFNFAPFKIFRYSQASEADSNKFQFQMNLRRTHTPFTQRRLLQKSDQIKSDSTTNNDIPGFGTACTINEHHTLWRLV